MGWAFPDCCSGCLGVCLAVQGVLVAAVDAEGNLLARGIPVVALDHSIGFGQVVAADPAAVVVLVADMVDRVWVGILLAGDSLAGGIQAAFAVVLGLEDNPGLLVGIHLGLEDIHPGSEDIHPVAPVDILVVVHYQEDEELLVVLLAFVAQTTNTHLASSHHWHSQRKTPLSSLPCRTNQNSFPSAFELPLLLVLRLFRVLDPKILEFCC